MRAYRSASSTMRASMTVELGASVGKPPGRKRMGTTSDPGMPGIWSALIDPISPETDHFASPTSRPRPSTERATTSSSGSPPFQIALRGFKRPMTSQRRVHAVKRRRGHATQLLPRLPFEGGAVSAPVCETRLSRRFGERRPVRRNHPKPQAQEWIGDAIEAALATSLVAPERDFAAYQPHFHLRRKRSRQTRRLPAWKCGELCSRKSGGRTRYATE